MDSNGNGNLNKPATVPRASLDLDALYGVSEPLTLTWGGRKYDLLRPEALGPRALVRLDALRADTNGFNVVTSTLTEAQSEEIERVTGEALAILCPTLDVALMPFVARMSALVWYFQQVTPPGSDEKKTRSRPIGATRSRRSRSGTGSGSRN